MTATRCHEGRPGAQTFAKAPDGSGVSLVRLERGGTSIAVMSWGASVQDIRRAERPHSLVLGSGDFEPYLAEMRYFGAIVGPVANRIANGCIEIDGAVYDLEKNESGVTTLHGGTTGLGVRNWHLDGYDDRSCRLSCRHADGESGFPGNLRVSACYALDESGALQLDLIAETDTPTYCNLAHHSYWNLDGTADLRGHKMQILADTYLPVDEDLIPIGTPAAVTGTRFDFTTPRTLPAPGGDTIDHNFCLDDRSAGQPACILAADGIRLEIETTEPGLQVYDGAGLNTGRWAGHLGRPYGANAGVALEPQVWPDAPNREGYPPSLLGPGETYHQTSVFRLTVDTETATEENTASWND